VSRESKVLIGVGALVVIGLILALMGQTTFGVIAVLIGLAVGVIALRVTQPDASDPFAAARSEADLTNTGTLTPSDGLAPWSPDGGLNAWTPPTDLASPPAAPTYEPPAYEAPAYEPPAYEPPAYEPPALETPTYEAPAYDAPAYEPPAYEPPAYEAPTYQPEPVTEPEPTSAGSWDEGWDSSVSWAPEAEPTVEAPQAFQPEPYQPDSYQPDSYQPESNPLDDLVGLDSLDPIAEVERIESRGSMFDAPKDYQPVSGFDDVDIHGNAIINEQVSTADDIMAASQATELNLASSDEQTELQKLLAKVQIRLSAYE
jgi:hypothetical protein